MRDKTEGNASSGGVISPSIPALFVAGVLQTRRRTAAEITLSLALPKHFIATVQPVHNLDVHTVNTDMLISLSAS